MAKVFISYSHRDEKALDRLHTHLATLRRTGEITAWFDREVLAGDDIDSKIGSNLDNSELFFALVSPDFLASNYCYEREMTVALKRHEEGSLRVIPIILEPCDWKSTPLGKLKALPKDGPQVCTARLSDAKPGSILKVPRSGGPLLVLVTDLVAGDGRRAVVVLNGKLPNRPSVFFADNWSDIDSCLVYKMKLHFELTNIETEIDPRGHEWREIAGVIVLIDDQLYIRVAPQDSFYDNFRLINIQSGAVLSQQTPNNVWSFGRWCLWLRDSIPERHVKLLEFSVSNQRA